MKDFLTLAVSRTRVIMFPLHWQARSVRTSIVLRLQGERGGGGILAVDLVYLNIGDDPSSVSSEPVRVYGRDHSGDGPSGYREAGGRGRGSQ